MQILPPGDYMQFPNRTVLPKSPFFKGGLEYEVLTPLWKGGQGGFSMAGVEAKWPHEGSARGCTGETPVSPVLLPFGKNLSLQTCGP